MNYLRFLDFLEEAYETHAAQFHAYCLMENHFHFMIETPRGNLSQIMQFINSAYSIYLNKRQKRVGHLFQGRFKSILIEAESYAQLLTSYIHLNPVRADIAELPDQYCWSSYRDYVGLRKPPPWLKIEFVLGLFSQDRTQARRLYASFVLSQAGRNPESLRQDFIRTAILGCPEFVEKITSRINPDRHKDRELPALRSLIEKPPLNRIQSESDRVLGRNNKFNRDAVIWIAGKKAGYSLKDVADYFNLSQSGIAKISIRMKTLIRENNVLRQAVEEITKNLTK